MKKQYVFALVALVVFCACLFFLTHFSKASILSTEGYFVSNEKIEEVLLSEDKKLKSGNIKLEKVSYNDSFYVNLNKLYVGEEKKTSVNDNYPIFSNDGKAIVNLNDKAKLINNKFEFFASYENFTLTGGKLYNYGDSEQADYEDYLFLQLANMTYVNLYEIKIKTLTHEYTIPLNSIINFQEDYLKYYYYDKQGKLIYGIVEGIDLESQVTMGESHFTYKHLLISIDKITVEEDESDKGNTGDNPDDDYIIDNGNGSGNPGVKPPTETKYIKPKVTAENFVPNVYSASSSLHISDPAGVIAGGINFQFKIGDKILLRKTYISSGKFEVTGLIPNTEFTIIGSFKYYNEEKKKMEQTFFEQKIKTQGIDKLPAIDMDFTNGPVYSNKLQVDKLRITSDLKSETIKGVSKGVIYINGELYYLSSNIIQDLISGKEKTYTSPAKLQSNQEIDYSFKLLDAFGNEIKLNAKKGHSRTSKEAPNAVVKVVKSEVSATTIGVTLKNEDGVSINPFRYVVYNKDMVAVAEGSLDKLLSYQEITLKSLNPNSAYQIHILGNFNIEDGNGVVKNVVIGEGKFTTMPLSSLGFFRITSDATDLTHNSVRIVSSLDLGNISPLLLDLLNSFTVNVYDKNETKIYSKTYKGLELDPIKGGQEFVEELTGLESVQEYKVEFTSTVVQGTIKENISVLSSLKKFKTYKRPASVNIINKFVNGSMIDFDVKVSDPDGAVESGRVLLEVRDSAEKLIAMENLNINADYKRLVYEKLNQEQNYSFTYKVEEYNIGYDNSTYEGDYTLFQETILTEQGIKGSIELEELLRQMTGKNLFNIYDYDRIRKEGNIGTKEYDLKNRTMTISAKNGYVNYSYFLPEMHKKSVQISFYAKYAEDTPNQAPVYIGKSYGQNLDYKLDGLSTTEWKKYTFSFLMSNKYIGFVINETANINMKTEVKFKDIQIISMDLSDAAKNDVTYSYHDSGYKFTDAVMHAGNENMPSPTVKGENIIGNSGNGYAKITNLDTKAVTEFNYTGGSQTFTVPSDGTYRFEGWGAQGGTNGSYIGGKGAYTSGKVSLKKGTNIYVYVGGAGNAKSSTTNTGGYNGGGYSGNNSGAQSYGGGGATDFRLTSGAWNNSTSLKSRIMVAGGGGGATRGSSTTGGAGGGLEGLDGTSSNPSYQTATYLNSGGTQTTGGISYEGTRSGSFGYAIQSNTGGWGGGGGGGYYGGANGHGTTGAGGSSYISGYEGCVSYSKTLSLSDEFEDYTEKDEYIGTLNMSLYDTKNEIQTNDFYVRIYLNGDLEATHRYDLNLTRITDFKKQFEFLKNKNYAVKLSVKIRDRFYDIASLEFNTNTEIRAIRTVSEFYGMHPNGKYIVMNDLDFTSNGSIYSTPFYGELDFQGNKMIWNVQGRASYLIHTIGSGAKVSNVVVEATLDNPSNRNWFYGFAYQNYGTIDNFMLNILKTTNVPNYAFTPGVYVNYGVIKNFVINCQESFSASAVAGLLVWTNQGTIRNGYVYGENIKAYHENANRSRKDVAVIAGETTTNSRIENVFSLITVEKDQTLSSETSVGNLIGYSSTGTLQNVYSVEDPDKVNTNLTNQDPNIGYINGINAQNVFYSSDRTYNASKSTKISKLALYDSDFQKKVLNTHDGFIVDKYVSLGYYPQVNMHDCMPKQEWIPLPKVTESDLVDITSTEVVESTGDSAIAILNINNPGAEKIKKIGIQDISKVEILSQEDEWGKSKVKVKLSEPKKYQSKYYVRSMTIVGAMGFEYEKTYGQFERGLDIDLYFPINSLSDWKLIKDTPNQNYILKTDLDFKGVTISNYVVGGTFSGKLNGDGHVLKNISISSNNAMFNNLTGTIKNLYVENYTKSNLTSNGGFIYQGSGNAVIDNVHMTNVSTTGYTYVGGIIGYGSNLTIKNSSVTGYKNTNTENREDIRIGGLAGYLSNSLIQNSYAQDVDISIMDAVSTYGIGGIIGQMGSGTIENVYATGQIRSNSTYAGGIVGYGNIILTNAWSNVDIATEHEFVGGIFGRRDSSNISNTLVVGPIYSTYTGQYINRTNGNPLVTQQNNYAWDKQKFFGYITGDASSETLLSEERLQDVNTYYDLLTFGDQFDYSKITESVLPKLKNYDTGELLPNQKDSKLEYEEFEIIDTQVDAAVTDAIVKLEINNPNNLEITDIDFDYLSITKSKIVTKDGITIAEATVTPTKYYDSYTLTKIKYTTGSGPDKTYNKTVRIPVQFFKTISKFEDWQQISKQTAENYRLVADIDFTGKTNINYNVSIGRLEGQDNGYTLKNFTANPKSTGYFLIRKITKSLKNVTFDNFNIETTASGNYVNIIKYNYGDVENVHFNNISIQAPNASYIAPIARHRGVDLREVTIHNNNMKGVSYVAGLIAQSLNYDTYGVTASDCTIYGKDRYIGGVIGYKDYIYTPNNFSYTATNMNITGKSDVGGIFGYGGANNSSISDSTITGLNGGEYIGSFSGRAGQYLTRVVDVRNCTVLAHGNNYVGGAFGWTYDAYDVYVYDTTVTQENSSKSYTGGVIGHKPGYTHQRIGIRDSIVTSAGIGTGGILGSFYGEGSLYYSYVYNTEVNGVDRVGGVAGYANSARLYYNITNARVNSTGNYAGGIFGYLNNVDSSNSSYSTVTHNVIAANTEVTGKNYVGGYAGYAPQQLTNSYYYNTILAVNTRSTVTGGEIGPITGFDSVFSESVPRFYVYEKNKINDAFIKDINTYPSVVKANLATANNLATQSYYTGRGLSTSYWDYSGLAKGFYPKVKNNSGTQVDLKLPVDTVSFSLRATRPLEPRELPKYTIYSSGANTLNIDFDKTDQYSYFELYENDKKVLEQDILKRTYTFNYNYKSDLKIVITDGYNHKEAIYKAEDFINKVSTFDNKYAYIYDGSLRGNIVPTKDKYIHIFGDKALAENLNVYDLSETTFISESNIFDVELLGEALPLYKFTINEIDIDTYATYSIIHRKDGDIIYDKQLFVKNGEVEVVDNSLDNKKDSVIIDNYAKDNYVTVLGNDGIIYNLKEEIKLPSNFSNKNIKYMSNNINSKSSAVVVMYNTGKVVIFDYRTGKLVKEEKAFEDVSVIDYFRDNLSNRKAILGDGTKNNYNDSLELKEHLEQNPIVESDNGEYAPFNKNEGSSDKDNNKNDRKANYITYYNAVTEDYDVIDVTDIIEEGKTKVVTENDKIYTSPELVSYYMTESIFQKVFGNTNGLVIFITILVGIVLAMGLWIINIKLLKVSEER